MKVEELHWRQIPTTYKTIKNELYTYDATVVHALLRCFLCNRDSDEYIMQLLVVSNILERISCLVYRSRGGKYKKLSAEDYKKYIFEGYAETPEEIADLIKDSDTGDADVMNLYTKLWQIADLVCQMIACVSEQAFVSEYAYAIDYIIGNEKELPKPDIDMLFPKNYPDFHYWEGAVVEKLKIAQGFI